MDFSYKQVAKVKNPQYRDDWILNRLKVLSGRKTGSAKTVLDVGAGSGPYKQSIIEMGFSYTAHDFGRYDPGKGGPGLQNDMWNYTELDFTCDILDIPKSAAADIVMCTEVLEHVPDPARAFHKLWTLVRPGGRCSLPSRSCRSCIKLRTGTRAVLVPFGSRIMPPLRDAPMSKSLFMATTSTSWNRSWHASSEEAGEHNQFCCSRSVFCAEQQ